MWSKQTLQGGPCAFFAYLLRDHLEDLSAFLALSACIDLTNTAVKDMPAAVASTIGQALPWTPDAPRKRRPSTRDHFHPGLEVKPRQCCPQHQAAPYHEPLPLPCDAVSHSAGSLKEPPVAELEDLSERKIVQSSAGSVSEQEQHPEDLCVGPFRDQIASPGSQVHRMREAKCDAEVELAKARAQNDELRNLVEKAQEDTRMTARELDKTRQDAKKLEAGMGRRYLVAESAWAASVKKSCHASGLVHLGRIRPRSRREEREGAQLAEITVRHHDQVALVDSKRQEIKEVYDFVMGPEYSNYEVCHSLCPLLINALDRKPGLIQVEGSSNAGKTTLMNDAVDFAAQFFGSELSGRLRNSTRHRLAVRAVELYGGDVRDALDKSDWRRRQSAILRTSPDKVVGKVL